MFSHVCAWGSMPRWRWWSARFTATKGSSILINSVPLSGSRSLPVTNFISALVSSASHLSTTCHSSSTNGAAVVPSSSSSTTRNTSRMRTGPWSVSLAPHTISWRSPAVTAHTLRVSAGITFRNPSRTAATCQSIESFRTELMLFFMYASREMPGVPSISSIALNSASGSLRMLEMERATSGSSSSTAACVGWKRVDPWISIRNRICGRCSPRVARLHTAVPISHPKARYLCLADSVGEAVGLNQKHPPARLYVNSAFSFPPAGASAAVDPTSVKNSFRGPCPSPSST
mmetsp:Transcript_1743/g.3528  ORF Transcript_1743/g.3528 Transcript_1743/m.3528 type:complete len:288 (+) Transcript_1743:107-970(+)